MKRDGRLAPFAQQKTLDNYISHVYIDSQKIHWFSQITYFSVADRLGVNQSPKIQIIRGGLQMKYIVAKMWTYNAPIAATVSVGCANKKNVQRIILNHTDNSNEYNEIHTESSGKTVILYGQNKIPSEISDMLNGTSELTFESTTAIPSDTTGSPSQTTEATSEVPSETTEVPKNT